ncbi:histidinol-phosphatase HisJ family protein [Ruminococcus sp. OA3]|uniref:histidinol-phosphatase HisJ family protein n=1 Tax=Ruminococcus sp. OA3 TaxID=2914164 RepID=UPI001F059F7E|nr:histidinol-phosphatase HisJ family protein [Ruminococcus sp. OA3]MCH1984488.1 histidinol-phosphatase HisJ family protein [Ruminococcus sp. OA3]
MTCDLHIHSRYSFDSSESLAEICRWAVKRNIGVIAITDHCDMIQGRDGIAYYLEVEKQRIKAFEKVREEYQQLEVLYGIEIGNAIDCPEETRKFLKLRKFDFIIGAIHFLPDGGDIYKLPYRDAGEVKRMFRDYFISVEKLVRLGGFDSLAHLDYPLRVLKGKVSAPTIENYRELVEPILSGLILQGIALEVNTRGIYDWQGRVGPEDWVLTRYRELGGRLLTIGSDAHTAFRTGVGFENAAEMLRRTGFRSYTIYRGRKPVEIPI